MLDSVSSVVGGHSVEVVLLEFLNRVLDLALVVLGKLSKSVRLENTAYEVCLVSAGKKGVNVGSS